LGQETVFKADDNLRIHLVPLLEVSRIDKLPSISAGVASAMTVGKFYTGLYYLGHQRDEVVSGKYDLRFQHAGLWSGYFSNPQKLLHFHGGLKLGYGTIVKDYIVASNNIDQFSIDRYISDLFIVNPTVGTELNLTKSIKLGFNAGYRLVTEVNVIETHSYTDIKDYEGLNLEATVRIGCF
jgi:hypothetical protein